MRDFSGEAFKDFSMSATTTQLLSSGEFCKLLYDTKNSPVTGLEWPRGFQEFKVPRFHDNGTGWW
jgi:hypothetical protein